MADPKLTTALSRPSLPTVKSTEPAKVETKPVEALVQKPALTEKQKRAAGLADGLSTTVAALTPPPSSPSASDVPVIRAGSAGSAAALQAAVKAPKYSLDDIKKASKSVEITSDLITTPTTAFAAPEGFTDVTIKVPWRSQAIDGAINKDNKDCNKASRKMMAEAPTPTTPGDSGVADNFNVATSRDTFGRINPDKDIAKMGREYIDQQLDAGKPVLVGVTGTDLSKLPVVNQGRADHYIVVTGRGVDETGMYYRFNDPATTRAEVGNDQNPRNRLYVDQNTGLLFREGKTGGYLTSARYEVSQIRKNQ